MIEFYPVQQWGNTRLVFARPNSEEVLAIQAITGNTHLTPALKLQFERLGVQFEQVLNP